MISKLHPQRAGGFVQKCSTLYTSLLSQYILIHMYVCMCMLVKQQCKVFTCPLIQEPEKSVPPSLVFLFCGPFPRYITFYKRQPTRVRFTMHFKSKWISNGKCYPFRFMAQPRGNQRGSGFCFLQAL